MTAPGRPAHRRWGRSRSAQKGFSLLEIIAAIAVLAIAFAALMQVAGSSLSLTARANERTQAALRARSLLDGAFVMESLQAGETEGRFDDTYRWRLNVSPWQAPDARPDADNATASVLYRLDLDVSWGQGDAQRHARFSTLRLGAPPGSGP